VVWQTDAVGVTDAQTYAKFGTSDEQRDIRFKLRFPITVGYFHIIKKIIQKTIFLSRWSIHHILIFRKVNMQQ
jgi:hypothetical protein